MDTCVQLLVPLQRTVHMHQPRLLTTLHCLTSLMFIFPCPSSLLFSHHSLYPTPQVRRKENDQPSQYMHTSMHLHLCYWICMYMCVLGLWLGLLWRTVPTATAVAGAHTNTRWITRKHQTTCTSDQFFLPTSPSSFLLSLPLSVFLAYFTSYDLPSMADPSFLPFLVPLPHVISCPVFHSEYTPTSGHGLNHHI